MFNEAEIAQIKRIRMHDVIHNSTRFDFIGIQDNVFQYSNGNYAPSLSPSTTHTQIMLVGWLGRRLVDRSPVG
ncbi:hypothetical protein DPMN_076167 [Dreissena polymorpha]|uniref:Uncharacterized protein n=1 Tax=Dreissena polymorpha TaxID=45954 RepID=A0A9D3YLW4_DREPO|nr:hypothetical protein DPMN_076167 [Dreissena polymorpha]